MFSRWILKCSAAGCLILHLHIQTHTCRFEMLQKIHKTLTALPQFHKVTQQQSMFLSGNCKAARWPERCDDEILHLSTSRSTGDARDVRSKRLTLPSIGSPQSHWAIQATATQEYAAYGATRHCFQGAIQLGPLRGWCAVVPLAVGVSLVALGLRTITTVVMVFIPQNVTKITAWHTVQTEVLSVSSANLCERLSLPWAVTVTYWQWSGLYVLNNGQVIGYGFLYHCSIFTDQYSHHIS